MEVELDNFYFGPTVIEATPGQAFKVELFNEGAAPHTFTIDSLSHRRDARPRGEEEITITAPAAAGTVAVLLPVPPGVAEHAGGVSSPRAVDDGPAVPFAHERRRWSAGPRLVPRPLRAPRDAVLRRHPVDRARGVPRPPVDRPAGRRVPGAHRQPGHGEGPGRRGQGQARPAPVAVSAAAAAPCSPSRSWW